MLGGTIEQPRRDGRVLHDVVTLRQQASHFALRFRGGEVPQRFLRGRRDPIAPVLHLLADECCGLRSPDTCQAAQRFANCLLVAALELLTQRHFVPVAGKPEHSNHDAIGRDIALAERRCQRGGDERGVLAQDLNDAFGSCVLRWLTARLTRVRRPHGGQQRGTDRRTERFDHLTRECSPTVVTLGELEDLGRPRSCAQFGELRRDHLRYVRPGLAYLFAELAIA